MLAARRIGVSEYRLPLSPIFGKPQCKVGVRLIVRRAFVQLCGRPRKVVRHGVLVSRERG
jgi:hypothetical protein